MLSFFPRDVLDEIWGLIESVSEGFPTCCCTNQLLLSVFSSPVAYMPHVVMLLTKTANILS